MSAPAATTAARGRKGIEAIRDKMQRLVQFYQDFKPDAQLILSKPDYDLIARWPRAAHECGFDVTHNGVFYGGFKLTYNTEHGRYDPKITVNQAVIE